MAYRKRSRKRTYKRRPAGKKSGTNWNNIAYTAGKALSLATWIASVVNPEVKHVDTVLSVGGISSTGQVSHITNINEGDTQHDRNGTSVKASYITCKGAFQMGSVGGTGVTGLPQSNNVRMIIFNDTMDNQSTPPTVTDVLETASVWSPREVDARPGNRYAVMYDKLHALSLEGKNQYVLDWSKKLKHHVHWSDSDGTHTLTGHIYVLLISQVTGAVFDGYFRFGYYDN